MSAWVRLGTIRESAKGGAFDERSRLLGSRPRGRAETTVREADAGRVRLTTMKPRCLLCAGRTRGCPRGGQGLSAWRTGAVRRGQGAVRQADTRIAARRTTPCPLGGHPSPRCRQRRQTIQRSAGPAIPASDGDAVPVATSLAAPAQESGSRPREVGCRGGRGCSAGQQIVRSTPCRR
jgi:hypothetical protein